MSELIMGQNTGEPNQPSSGKIALGYNNVTGRFEGKLPGGTLVLFESDYGKQLAIAQRIADVTTTSGSPQDYQQIALTNLEIGKVYQVDWSWAWSLDDITSKIGFRILLDSSSLAGFIYQIEPKDATDIVPNQQTYFFVATSTSHTITAQFARVGSSGTATMKRSALKVFNTGLDSIPTGA